MPTKTYQFGAEDALLALGITATDVEIQSFNADLTQQEASAFGNYGDILVDGTPVNVTTMYDKMRAFSLTCKCKADTVTSPTTLILGGIGYTITSTGTGIISDFATGYGKLVLASISISQPPTMATITLTGHSHFGSGTHSARGYTITLPAFGRGVQVLPFAFGTGAAHFPPITDYNSYSFSASVSHEEVLTRKGVHAYGTSYNARLTESIELTSGSDFDLVDITTPTTFLTPATNWNISSDGKPQTNTGYKRRSISFFSNQVADITP